MNCHDFCSHIDEYLDHALPPDQLALMQAHQGQCVNCQDALLEAQRLQQLLRDLPVPEPKHGFHDRVLANAAHQNRDTQHLHQQRNGVKHRRGFISGFASAIAAGLMIWIAFGLFTSTEVATVKQSIPGLSIALNKTRNVKVTFDSQRALDGATITLQLPDSIELAGYPGRRELSWKTNLVSGNNQLRLPIMAVKAVDGQLVVKIEHQNQSKTLRINLKITQPDLTLNGTDLLGA